MSNGGNYTKHIYMGGQRITSKVSNSGIFTSSPVTTTDLQAKYTAQTVKIKERFDSLRITYKGSSQTGGLISKVIVRVSLEVKPSLIEALTDYLSKVLGYCFDLYQ